MLVILLYMSILALIVLWTTPGRTEWFSGVEFFLVLSFVLGLVLGLGGVMNMWPVNPFESVTVIKGYTPACSFMTCKAPPHWRTWLNDSNHKYNVYMHSRHQNAKSHNMITLCCAVSSTKSFFCSYSHRKMLWLCFGWLCLHNHCMWWVRQKHLTVGKMSVQWIRHACWDNSNHVCLGRPTVVTTVNPLHAHYRGRWHS